MIYNYIIKKGPVFKGIDINNNQIFSNSKIYFLGTTHAEILSLSQIHLDFIKCSPLRRKTIKFNRINRYNRNRLIKVTVKE